MDFIFGTLATDDLKLVHHRAERRGLQHRHQLWPADPRPGEPVTLTVQLGTDFSADHVACYYTLDGSIPSGSHGVADNGHVLHFQSKEVDWDTLNWGYVGRWQAVIPAQPEGTIVRYRVGAWSDGGTETFADWPNVTAIAEAAADAFFRKLPQPTGQPPGDPSQGDIFTYRVDTLSPPEWAREAIIYHVFVDRFSPGIGCAWLQTDDLMGFCGGTLWGVRDRLDYIEDLGANCLWLSPVWVSPTHHGYDVADFDRVESRLGGNDALHALVEAAHARNIRILLDMACNHISNQHPIFQSALANVTSPYRDWFTFNDSAIGYRTFFNAVSMPQVNLANPAARDWMIGIARRWLREFDVDGYRLDYANGPGPDFWSDFRVGCRAEKPDCFLFGEIVDAPDVLRTYAGRLDGCLDFHLGDALRRTFGWKTWTDDDLERFIARHYAYFPSDFLLPLFLDNHDMDRFLYIAGGDKEALRRAAALQMRLPAPPIIYYGTEIGLSQPVGVQEGMGLHVSRTPMIWDDRQDKDLLAFYKQQIQDRRIRLAAARHA